MMKIISRLLLGITLIISLIIFYTLWDNLRITVAEETIYIDDLPKDLQGYTILQISDLHEKKFGKNQRRLINKVNKQEYDSIVFTGDMLDDENSKNYKPTYDLLEGIENLDNALFVPGNTDPENTYMGPTYSREKHEFIKGMGERGVKKLDSVYTITRGDAKIHFVEFALSLIDKEMELKKLQENSSELNEDDQYLQTLYKEISVIDKLTDQELLISLYHYPLPDVRIDIHKNDESIIFRDYDLHIAGHYHGGQIRIPFYGAVIVPEAYYDNYGLFPPRDRVDGLWEYDGLKQYVSTGLGSSKAVGFLNFRLFNTPEINLLTLEKNPE
ncbi:metallophosphoesterase [Salipaludibacillus sp. HK11]|uniref:metallophosphoesterase n=1 Tax=Salipaludibacillus sp. HK11 TaxID=3394320 RepID=UPI0039FCAFDE